MRWRWRQGGDGGGFVADSGGGEVETEAVGRRGRGRNRGKGYEWMCTAVEDELSMVTQKTHLDVRISQESRGERHGARR